MRTYRTSKRASVILLILVAVMLFGTISAVAQTPYVTYTINGYGQIRQTQTAYLAYSTITKFDDVSLVAPSDMVITEEGIIYVADTGYTPGGAKTVEEEPLPDEEETPEDAPEDGTEEPPAAEGTVDKKKKGRIVVGNLEGELLGIIGEGILTNPRGVFVTEDGMIYVADRDAEMIFVFNREGEVLQTYGKPDSPLYGQNLSFLPVEIVVNDAGIMFIVCESNTNGIVEISPTDGGTFLGYFGTNYTSVSVMDVIYRAILTDAQRAKLVSNLPATPTNLAINQKGLIYTVTRGNGNDTLKLLNIAGTNMIKNEDNTYADTPVAVVAGYHDNVYVADQQGYIFEYNSEGELLFVFGGPDDGSQRVGLSSMVSSIAIDTNDRIYVLDSDKCRIQVYEPTEFTNLLHEALYLYSKGRYTESKEPLSQVLAMNSMFDYANKAMGRAYFQEENYEMALKYARLAKDVEGYSDAYWEIRNQWLKHYIVPSILILVGIWVAVKAIDFWDKKKGILAKPKAWLEKFKGLPVITDLCYSGYYMKHPVDGAYGISREGRAKWLSATIILVVFMVEFVINKYTCGFLFKTVMDGRYEIMSDIGVILVGIVALTGCTYLVCTINEGEGTIKKLYTMFCYSLLPYVLLMPVNYLLSHVLTGNEVFLVNMLNILIYGWMTVLVFIGIKEVNNYTVGETVKVILLTLFAALILVLLMFILYVLWAQVFEFVTAIVGEVVYSLGY